jgi:ribosomal protein S27AE
MPVKYEFLHKAECDNCPETVSQNYFTQKDFLKQIRNDGWTVSNNRILCPRCSNKSLVISLDRIRDYRNNGINIIVTKNKISI